MRNHPLLCFDNLIICNETEIFVKIFSSSPQHTAVFFALYQEKTCHIKELSKSSISKLIQYFAFSLETRDRSAET